MVATWSDEEDVRRAMTFARLVKSKDGPAIRELSVIEVRLEAKRPALAEELRKRLEDISAYMGALAKHIALGCDREDAWKGTFWEGRFEGMRLENEASVLVCGIYVDMNQIRAGEVATPAAHIGLRSHRCLDRGRPEAGRLVVQVDARRAGSAGPSADCGLDGALPTRGCWGSRSNDTWSSSFGSCLTNAAGKRGTIPSHLAPVHERLRISRDAWFDLVTNFQKRFGLVVRAPE